MKKNWFIYGGLMGLLLFVLDLTQYKTIIQDIGTDLYGAIIGCIFLIVGITIGLFWYKKKEKTEKYDRSMLGLSSREVEVLEQLALGLSNQEIADKLFVSLNTIKTHISSIYQKLNVKRRTQAIQKARSLALLPNKSDN